MDKAVVVGSLHYDIFVEGPRRPLKGETVMGYRWYPKFGGKGGNQALAMANAGIDVSMVSAVGNDSFAPQLIDVLKQNNVNTDNVQHLESVKSGMSVAIADSEMDYGAVVVSGANMEIDTTKIDFEQVFNGAKTLVLQNEVSEKTNIAAAKAAKLAHVCVCLNAAPVRTISNELIDLIDILVVNQVEAAEIAGQSVNNLDEAVLAAEKLRKRFSSVVVTVGGSGVAYSDKDGTGSVSGNKVEVVSTHGAGDYFVGELCAAMIKGQSLKEAVFKANNLAAVYVSSHHDDRVL